MRRSLLLLALAACQTGAAAPTARPAAPETREYIYFAAGGENAGEETVTTGADGRIRVVSRQHNNGRGPKTTSEFRLEGGLPVEVRVDGRAEVGEPVAERFQVAGGVARWESRADRGERALGGAPRYYATVDGPSFEQELMARAALAAPGHKIALVPAGEMAAEIVEERTVRGPAGEARVSLVGLSGLYLETSYLWLDDKQQLFASVNPWISLVRKGWDGAIKELLDEQLAVEERFYAALPGRSTRRPAALLVRGARVFDADARVARDGLDILVRGDRIVDVGPRLAAPADAEVIDGRGMTALPGLWDMHTHVDRNQGVLDIANGVTTVRDLGNDFDMTVKLRQQWSDGTLVGPRLILAGIVDGPGENRDKTTPVVSDEASARAAVEKYAGAGFVQIKIYNSTPPSLVPTIARLAHEHGMRVSGHVPAFMRAEEAVRAGYDEIQHCNMLFLNFMPDVADTRTPVRFIAPAQRAAELDLDSPPVRAFIELLRSRHTVIDPTLAIFENMFTARPGSASPHVAAIVDRLPALTRRALYAGGLEVPAGMDERYRASFQRMLQLVGRMYAAGIQVVAGTDDLAGFALHRELELYVQAGIPAPEVLSLATLGAARVMKRDADVGSLAKGKLADLVLVAGDPTTRISDVRNVRVVVKGGVVYDVDALLGAVGVQK